MHERFPRKWSPHKWDWGVYGIWFFQKMLHLTIRTYTVDDWVDPEASMPLFSAGGSAKDEL
jgi:hypothetical protein